MNPIEFYFELLTVILKYPSSRLKLGECLISGVFQNVVRIIEQILFNCNDVLQLRLPIIDVSERLGHFYA